MKAMILPGAAPVEDAPLQLQKIPVPVPGTAELLLEVKACGICRTDLHIIEGELPPSKSPLVPGHQIVGVVKEAGAKVTGFKVGDRVGVPWLHWACGQCYFCRRGQENLCEAARFTGYDVDGGFAEYTLVSQDFAYSLPPNFSDEQAAPLLCAGIIGYRALRLAGVGRGERLGMYGFGASAHVTIQVAGHRGNEVFVVTRKEKHRQLARQLKAAWVGGEDDIPPAKLDGAIIFAPAGPIVPQALAALRKGGTLVLAGIYMTPIPEMNYQLLYHERVIRSVANYTRQDAKELLQLAGEIPIKTQIEVFPLEEANRALLTLKRDGIKGAGVLKVG
jgi:propanol-preferring alcohol dehydrogenase